MTDLQEWQHFVRSGFICSDMEGAKRAFLAGLNIGNGNAKSQDTKDETVLKKIEIEIAFLSQDSYTAKCMRDMGVDTEKAKKLLSDFETSIKSKGEDHKTLNLARQHFINWVNIMKDKQHGTDKQSSTDEWQRNLIDRLCRLSGNNTSRTQTSC